MTHQLTYYRDMTTQPQEREHYLYVNMRDVGCNCGERCRGVERGQEAREAWFADHMARITTAPAAS